MILTTTSSIEGHPAKDYLGIVTGEVIVGANIFKDLFAGIRDVVGGRSGSYESTLRDAREAKIAEESIPPLAVAWHAARRCCILGVPWARRWATSSFRSLPEGSDLIAVNTLAFSRQWSRNASALASVRPSKLETSCCMRLIAALCSFLSLHFKVSANCASACFNT